MFTLLSHFSLDRNPFAPVLYKSLTFLLIEFHLDTDLREILTRHFIALFAQLPTIPVAILCEPLLKQIELEGGTHLQVYDFELLQLVVGHKRATVQVTTGVLGLMVRVAATDMVYHKLAMRLAVTVIREH